MRANEMAVICRFLATCLEESVARNDVEADRVNLRELHSQLIICLEEVRGPFCPILPGSSVDRFQGGGGGRSQIPPL
jgi:hypothetical protein